MAAACCQPCQPRLDSRPAVSAAPADVQTAVVMAVPLQTAASCLPLAAPPMPIVTVVSALPETKRAATAKEAATRVPLGVRNGNALPKKPRGSGPSSSLPDYGRVIISATTEHDPSAWHLADR